MMAKNFDEMFTSFYPTIQKMAAMYGRKTPVPAEEYESKFCEVFFLQFEEYNHKLGNFSAFMRVRLQQEATKLATRKERRFYDSIQYIDLPDDDDEDTKYPVELVDDVDIEQEVFDVMFVEEQLAKADDLTRSILEIFFTDPHVSYREIANQLGITHPTVKTRLQAVAEAVRNA